MSLKSNRLSFRILVGAWVMRYNSTNYQPFIETRLTSLNMHMAAIKDS